MFLQFLAFLGGNKELAEVQEELPKADMPDAPSENPQHGALSSSWRQNLLGCFPSAIAIQRNKGEKKPKLSTP